MKFVLSYTPGSTHFGSEIRSNIHWNCTDLSRNVSCVYALTSPMAYRLEISISPATCWLLLGTRYISSPIYCDSNLICVQSIDGFFGYLTILLVFNCSVSLVRSLKTYVAHELQFFLDSVVSPQQKLAKASLVAFNPQWWGYHHQHHSSPMV